jgi:hypothetical protein
VLKLAKMPRGTNRNRPLKLRPDEEFDDAEEMESLQEARRLFRRFWHNRDQKEKGDS